MGDSVIEVISRSVEQVTSGGYISMLLSFFTQLALFLLFVTVIYYIIHIGNGYISENRQIMIGRRHVMKIVLALLGLLAILIVSSSWSAILEIFAPFIAALIFAYILNPLVRLLQHHGVKRLWAVLLVYLGISLAILGLSLTVIPQIGSEIQGLLELLPDFSHQIYTYVNQFYAFINENLQNLPPELDVIKNIPTINSDWIQQVVINTLTSITNGLLSIFSSIFSVILVPVLTFYFLKDADIFQRSLTLVIPTKSRKKMIEMFREFDTVLGGFIRGQLIVATFVCVITIISLLLLKIRFAVVLGLIAGLFNVIPYFGPIIGAVPAVIFGLMDSPIKALWVVIMAIIIQQIESNILAPKIVGESVGLHPVVIVMALLIGGRYMGLIGMIFAIPVAGVLKIVGKYAVRYVADFK